MEAETLPSDGPPLLLLALILLLALGALAGLGLFARARRGWPVTLVAVPVVVLVTACATALMLVTERVLWLPDLSVSSPEGPVGAGVAIFAGNALLALVLAALLALLVVRLARRRRA